jgi:hypothetical protein
MIVWQCGVYRVRDESDRYRPGIPKEKRNNLNLYTEKAYNYDKLDLRSK